MKFLKEAENREKFFRRIAALFPTLDQRYVAIEKAYNYAKDAFREDLREEGVRYFEHLRAVALICIDYLRIKDHEIIIAALLHDIVEDKEEWTVERVMAEFGYNVAYYVECMTKPDLKSCGGSKEVQSAIYHGKFAILPREFFLIKMADRLHNLTTLHFCSREKQIRKIEETRRYYLPYAAKHLILLHEMEYEIEKLEKKWCSS